MMILSTCRLDLMRDDRVDYSAHPPFWGKSYSNYILEKVEDNVNNEIFTEDKFGFKFD